MSGLFGDGGSSGSSSVNNYNMSGLSSDYLNAGNLTAEQLAANEQWMNLSGGPGLTGSATQEIPQWAMEPVYNAMSSIGSAYNQQGGLKPFQWANFDTAFNNPSQQQAWTQKITTPGGGTAAPAGGEDFNSLNSQIMQLLQLLGGGEGGGVTAPGFPSSYNPNDANSYYLRDNMWTQGGLPTGYAGPTYAAVGSEGTQLGPQWYGSDMNRKANWWEGLPDLPSYIDPNAPPTSEEPPTTTQPSAPQASSFQPMYVPQSRLEAIQRYNLPVELAGAGYGATSLPNMSQSEAFDFSPNAMSQIPGYTGNPNIMNWNMQEVRPDLIPSNLGQTILNQLLPGYDMAAAQQYYGGGGAVPAASNQSTPAPTTPQPAATQSTTTTPTNAAGNNANAGQADPMQLLQQLLALAGGGGMPTGGTTSGPGNVAITQAALQRAPDDYANWALTQLTPKMNAMMGQSAQRGITGGTPIAQGAGRVASEVGRDVAQMRATLAPQIASSAQGAEGLYNQYQQMQADDTWKALTSLIQAANAMRQPESYSWDPYGAEKILAGLY